MHLMPEGVSQHTEPKLPREVILGILSFIPSRNRLKPNPISAYMSVSGTPHLVIFSPHLLLPYFADQYQADWSLERIARAWLKLTVLSDAMLMGSLKLDIERFIEGSSLENLAIESRSIQTPRRCKIALDTLTFSIDTFAESFKSWHSCIQELRICYCTLVTTDAIPIKCNLLKTVHVCFEALPILSSGIQLNSVTNLIIDCYWSAAVFSDNMVKDFAQVLSQLLCLQEVCMQNFDCRLSELDNRLKVKSNSIHSLEFDGPRAPILFPLFSDCRIERIDLETTFLARSERFFPYVKDIRIDVCSCVPVKQLRDVNNFLRVGSPHPRNTIPTEAKW